MNAPAGVPDVERSGRVGRHELDVDRTRVDRGDPAPGHRVGEDRRDRRLQGGVAESHVDEPGRRDLGGRDGRRGPGLGRLGLQLGGDRLRDRQRRHPIRPCESHREVAREVTMDRVGRALYRDLGAVGALGPCRAVCRRQRLESRRSRPPRERLCGSASGRRSDRSRSGRSRARGPQRQGRGPRWYRAEDATRVLLYAPSVGLDGSHESESPATFRLPGSSGTLTTRQREAFGIRRGGRRRWR